MSTVSLIESKLQQAFQPTQLEVIDDRDEHRGHAHQDSGHFTVIIAASQFSGKNRVAQHRMIYDALGSLMQTHIHALRIQVSGGGGEQ